MMTAEDIRELRFEKAAWGYRPEDIDERREQLEAARAREAMLQKQSHQEYLQAQATLSRAMSRIQAVRGKR